MSAVKVLCQAEVGMFANESVVTVDSEEGPRSFIVDKSLISQSDDQHFVVAFIINEMDQKYLISIVGEPADTDTSLLWLAKANVVSQFKGSSYDTF